MSCEHILPQYLVMSGLVMFRTRSTGLDSLLRQLLSVDCIQPAVVHMLLLRLSDYMDSTSISYVKILQLHVVCLL